MKKIGCFGWIALFLLVSIIGSGLKTIGTVGATAIIFGLVAGVIALYLAAKKQRGKNHSAELLQVAEKIDQWAASDEYGGTAETIGDEQSLFDITGVELLDFKSTGSSYSGGHAGISFPIIGRIRGNVGGSQGQITRNPEALTTIDVGTLKITSERIIFIGEKEARAFELSKVLDFELGPNGLWVKIAMTNKAKRESFQHMALDQISIGMAIGIANAWSKDGKQAAIKYAKNIAEQIRTTIAAEQAAATKP